MLAPRDTIIAFTIYLILFIGTCSTALWLSTTQANQLPDEVDHTVVFRESDGYNWVLYQMGNSVHQIRRDSITAVIWTSDGERNEVFYTGGRLANNLSSQELRMASDLDKEYKKTHDGHSAPLLPTDFIFFTSLPTK